MSIKNGQRIGYSPIGVDIGTRSINIVQLATSPEGPYIHKADIAMLPGEKIEYMDTLTEVLSEMMKRKHFHGREVISRMPASLVNMIPVKISRRENETLEQALLREAKEYIPYPIEEAVVDYLPITDIAQGTDEAQKILLIFARRSDVMDHLEMFKKIGYKVKAIDIGPNAINRAIKRFKKPSEKRILVINIGDANSFSTILWDDMLLIDRRMSWGENNVIEKIVSNLGMDAHESRRVVYRYGIDWSSTPRLWIDDPSWAMSDEDIPAHIYEIVAPALEELNKEIEKMLIYCTSEMKGAMIDQIYLIGSGGLLKHLNSYLQKTFGIGVRPFEPEGIFNHTEGLKRVVKDNLPVFIISIGLALRGYDA